MSFSWLSMLTVGTTGTVAELLLDPKLKYWVLLPISVVMILTGIIKQYIMLLIGPKYRGVPRVKLTESQYVTKGQILMGNGSNLDAESYQLRKETLIEVLQSGKYIAKENSSAGNGANEVANPFSDPGMSDAMMNMAKGNMANFIPQTIIMWWVNHFFAGFVLMKLPFPLTVRFKEMLQSGVSTSDLDVRWVSAISWYFISVLGLNPVYNLLMTSLNIGANMASPQRQQVLGGAGQPQPEVVMKNLANDLTIAKHQSCFEGIEERVLKMYG